MKLAKKAIAEFIGTFVLVLFGCGVAVATSSNFLNSDAVKEAFPDLSFPNSVNVVATAIAFGLVIVAMAYSIGNVSGCHINPAVSLGVFLSGKMKLSEMLGYIAAQIAGAIAGSAVLYALVGKDFGLGENGLYDGSIPKSIIIEVILTFVFVLVILFVTDDDKYSRIGGVVIGFTLTLVHLLGIPLTGTSVNPARSLAPAIFVCGDALKNVWVFILAPLIGATLAALCHTFLRKDKE